MSKYHKALSSQKIVRNHSKSKSGEVRHSAFEIEPLPQDAPHGHNFAFALVIGVGGLETLRHPFLVATT